MLKSHAPILLVLLVLFTSNLKAQTQHINDFNHANEEINSFNLSLNKKAIKQRLDSSIQEKYDTLNKKWVNSTLLTYTYDGNGNNTSRIVANWVDSIHSWKNYSNKIMLYNKSNQIISDRNYNCDSTNQWKENNRIEYNYDNVGNLILYKSYYTNTTTKQFQLAGKYIYVLNANGKPSAWYDSSSVFGDSVFECSYQAMYSYDDEKNLSQILYLRKVTDSINTHWIFDSKHDFTYDERNNCTSYKGFYWTDNNWVESYKNENSYDDKGNVKTLMVCNNWNSILNNYNNIDKLENFYDVNGNVISQDFENNFGNISKSKRQINYNNTYSYYDVLWPIYVNSKYSLTYNHMVLNTIGQALINDIWVSNTRETFYYSEIDFNGVKEMNQTLSNVFPNPSSGIINIASNESNIREIEIFDITGNLMYSLENLEKENSIKIDLTNKENGVYFIQIKTRDEQTSRNKIIITK